MMHFSGITTFFLYELAALLTDQRVHRSLDFEFRERDTNGLIYSGFFGRTNGLRGNNIDSIEKVSETLVATS